MKGVDHFLGLRFGGGGCGVEGVGAGGSAPAGAGKLPFTVSKETTGIVGPLRADGTVDYVAALNERYGKGVTPENNGFVKWLEVVGTGDEVLEAKTKAEVLERMGLNMCGMRGPWVYSVGDNGKDDGGVREGAEKDDLGVGAK